MGKHAEAMVKDILERRQGEEEEQQQASSPGIGLVELVDCIQELTEFTLHSHLNATLELDLGLSNDFCSALLLPHPNDAPPPSPPPPGQNPCHSPPPLYKHLALALNECVTSGGYLRAWEASFNDPKRIAEWNQLVRHEGAALLNACSSVDFELHVQEPFFTQLKDGFKTVEGRCAVGDYNRIGKGAVILLNKCVTLQVQDVHRYASFSEMLEAEGLERVLPGVKTLEKGVEVYRKFYTEEKEKSNGVLGICVARSVDQPYLSLARILSGLSYGGLLMLMDPSHSPAAMPDILPPEI